MKEENLIVLRKTEFLMDKVYRALVNFPKAEKYALCSEIKRAFYDLLRYISLGNKVKSMRLRYLQTADGHLQLLKTLIRQAKRMKYIGVGFYKEIDMRLTEIDKLLSGYIRSSKKGG